jgi:hypothetical protein
MFMNFTPAIRTDGSNALVMSPSGTNLPFRNVHCTAASGGNPDIEPTSAKDPKANIREQLRVLGNMALREMRPSGF